MSRSRVCGAIALMLMASTASAQQGEIVLEQTAVELRVRPSGTASTTVSLVARGGANQIDFGVEDHPTERGLSGRIQPAVAALQQVAVGSRHSLTLAATTSTQDRGVYRGSVVFRRDGTPVASLAVRLVVLDNPGLPECQPKRAADVGPVGLFES
jgi:hypothetical protein